jgi:hypothetical protein
MKVAFMQYERAADAAGRGITGLGERTGIRSRAWARAAAPMIAGLEHALAQAGVPAETLPAESAPSASAATASISASNACLAAASRNEARTPFAASPAS